MQSSSIVSSTASPRSLPITCVITGDLLDRWNPPLLERALDALGARGFLDPARVTIIHGNHDLPSSGGHPREQRDLLRLALRFWDPPPLLRCAGGASTS